MLEEVVGESEVQDALQHLFGEVVVDSVDLFLAKQTAEQRVERSRRIQIVPERLFDQHPRPPGRVAALDGQAARGQVAEDQLVVLRRDGEVEQLVRTHAPLLLDVAQMLGGLRVGCRVVELAALVLEQLEERFNVRGVGMRCPLGEDATHVSAQVLITPLATAETDDAQLVGQLALASEVEQRRHDLARHQVPGGTEDDKDRGVDGTDGLAGHL